MLDNIINELLKQYPNYERYNLCNWYNSEYLLTLKPIILYLQKNIVDNIKYEKNNITLEQFYLYLENRLQNGYYQQIKNIEINLSKTTHHEQRTPLWFAFRHKLISGSEAGYMLGVCGNASAINSFRGKIDLPYNKPNSESSAIQHGVNYENVAKRIYELRYKVEVLELGCISSITSFIGASPDGIVFKTTNKINNTNIDSWTRYGRLLEIKCPYTRIIDNNIKPEYDIQILQQQYTCKLPICDFLECGIIDTDHKGLPNITSYINYDDMLNDIYDTEYKIQNSNIPISNLTKEGYEKGIMIVIYKSTGICNEYGKKEYIPHQYLYPIDKPYIRHEIMSWIIKFQNTVNTSDYGCMYIKSWKLYNFSIKTKIYNQNKYEYEFIPKLSSIWNNIKLFRNMEETERFEQAKHLTTIESIILPFNIKENSISKLKSSNISKTIKLKKSGREITTMANNNLLDNLLENINLESI